MNAKSTKKMCYPWFTLYIPHPLEALSGYFPLYRFSRPSWPNCPLDAVQTIGCVRFGQNSQVYHTEEDPEVTVAPPGAKFNKGKMRIPKTNASTKPSLSPQKVNEWRLWAPLPQPPRMIVKCTFCMVAGQVREWINLWRSSSFIITRTNNGWRGSYRVLVQLSFEWKRIKSKIFKWIAKLIRVFTPSIIPRWGS